MLLVLILLQSVCYCFFPCSALVCLGQTNTPSPGNGEGCSVANSIVRNLTFQLRLPHSLALKGEVRMD